MNEGIKKATKRPVTIEYVTWNGTNAKEIIEFVGAGKLDYYAPCEQGMDRAFENNIEIPNRAWSITIPTLEGNMKAKRTDVIIKGVKGECYPCDFSVFMKTYDLEDYNKMNNWIKIEETTVIDYDFEVIGFNPEWVDEDFNPDGTRICFQTDAGEKGWCSSKWIDYQDCYYADHKSAPTHVMRIPVTPKLYLCFYWKIRYI